MIEAGVDQIVLGCSHYPYLIPAIKSHLPKHIELIDSGYAVARQTKAILEKKYAFIIRRAHRLEWLQKFFGLIVIQIH